MTPEKIEAQAVYVSELSQRLDRARDDLQEVEDMVTASVISARDMNDKPLYSNETSRAIAIRQTCRDLAKWRAAKDHLEAEELIKAMEQARLERYRSEFATWKLEHRRTTAEMETTG